MKKIITILSLTFSANLFAFIHCDKNVSMVWLATDHERVDIIFDDGSGIYSILQAGQSERLLNTMYSAGLAAITASKPLRVRYTHVAQCNLATGLTDKHSGFYLLK